MRMVDSIKYRVSNSEDLERRQLSRVQKMAAYVERFQVYYRMAPAFSGEDRILLPADGRFIRHILDPEYRATCEGDGGCVRWRNIGVVKIELEHGIELSAFSGSLPETEMGFRIETQDGKRILFHRYVAQFRPSQFANEQGDRTGAGVPVDCLNPMTGKPNIAARCDSSCVNAFTNPMRSEPDWEGFRVEEGSDFSSWSSYCKCAFDGTEFIPLEIDITSIPTYEAGHAFDNERLHSCFGYYGCSAPVLKSKDPRTALACDCLQDEDPSRYFKNNGSNADYEIFYSEFERLGQIDEENRKCTSYATCDGKARLLYGGNPHPWNQYCGCLTRNVEPDGRLGAGISKYSKDWSKLCNKTADTCPNTWDSTAGAYKAMSHDFPQGLTTEDLVLCECLKQYGGDYAARSQDYDFRAPRDGDDPEDPDGTTSENFGSNLSKDVLGVGYITEDGGGRSEIDGVCTAAFCEDGFSSTGCCVSGPSNYQGSSHNQYPNHKYYCHPSCLGKSQEVLTEIDKVRHVITNRAMNESLPVDCGGHGGTQF